MNCPLCGATGQATSFCTNCGQRIGPAAVAVDSVPNQTTRGSIARQQAADAYLKLERSEAAVLHAASRIYSAYVAGNRVTDQTEGEYMKKAVSTAIQLAVLTERSVQSDDEEW